MASAASYQRTFNYTAPLLTATATATAPPALVGTATATDHTIAIT